MPGGYEVAPATVPAALAGGDGAPVAVVADVRVPIPAALGHRPETSTDAAHTLGTLRARPAHRSSLCVPAVDPAYLPAAGAGSGELVAAAPWANPDSTRADQGSGAARTDGAGRKAQPGASGDQLGDETAHHRRRTGDEGVRSAGQRCEQFAKCRRSGDHG